MKPGFNGMRVLSLESRRAAETATLISKHGGDPRVVPALCERPLDSNVAALDFAAALLLGEIDIVIFLTGAGTRALFGVLGEAYPGGDVLSALARTKIAVRGPKPAAVLREMKVPIWVTAPEPNTWRELLAAIEARGADQRLGDARVAVQEYGVPNQELIEALAGRCASVMRVPVYRWALPDDLGPLRSAVAAIAGGGIDVLLLTSGVQLAHLWKVVRMMGCENEVRHGLSATVIASIGPVTSDEIRGHGLAPDIEASHPKLGFLVSETASRAASLVRGRSGMERASVSWTRADSRLAIQTGAGEHGSSGRIK